MSLHGPITLPSGRKIYQVRWREGASNRSRNFDGTRDGKKLATELDKQVRQLRQAGEFAAEMDRRRVTINDLYAEWLERSEPGLSAKAAANYATQLDLRVLPDLGAKRVTQLSVRDVERWISQMRDAGAGDPTILKACTVLQALLSMAVRDGIVTANVAQQAKKPGQARTRTPQLVKPEQVEVMRAFLVSKGRWRDVMLLELLAYAGLRPESEAITLPWSMVRDRSLLIRDTKRGKERSVPLLEPLQESLMAWRERTVPRSGKALVTPTGVGGAWTEHDWRNWRKRPFRAAAAAAGLPADVRPRDLRGSFVSLLVHEGRSIIEVARQLGHSPAICLRDYAQVFDEVDPAARRSATEVIREARTAAGLFAPGSHGVVDDATSDGDSQC